MSVRYCDNPSLAVCPDVEKAVVSPGSALPAGLTLAPSGVISGTPTDAAAGCTAAPFSLTVTDARSRTATRGFTMTHCFYAPPVIDTTQFGPFDSGSSLDVYLAAHGEHPGFTWSASSLPPGYSLGTDGHLTAAPVEVTQSFPVTVTDSVGVTTTATVWVYARPVYCNPHSPDCP